METPGANPPRMIRLYSSAYIAGQGIPLPAVKAPDSRLIHRLKIKSHPPPPPFASAAIP